MPIVNKSDFLGYDAQLYNDLSDDNNDIDYVRATEMISVFGQQKLVSVDDMDLDQATAHFEVKQLAIYYVLQNVALRNISINPNFPTMSNSSNMDEFEKKYRLYKDLVEESKAKISVGMLTNSIESPLDTQPSEISFMRS